MRGLLDGITAIPAIMAEQGCSREEAERLWISAMKAEAENATAHHASSRKIHST